MSLLPIPASNKKCDVQLFCFSHAGGGASSYYSWGKLVPEWLEVTAIQLPGHETRLSEPLINNWPELISGISAEIVNHITKPFAFFGHSMGALIALEVTKHLVRKEICAPSSLFLSGRNGPAAQSILPRISHESDDIFLDKISQRYGSLPTEIIAQKELREIFLPILRNDIALVESYAHEMGAPLDIPLYIYFGRDDKLISKELLGGWQDITLGKVTEREFSGGHFYLESERENLLKILFNDLSRCIPAKNK